jgi:uncharacterized protein (DUF488 family)
VYKEGECYYLGGTMQLHTIGYEGLDLETFGQLLELNNVCRIVDVREIPISRKPGFSKTRLNEFLHSIGIEYVHIAKLGCPKFIRHDYREDKNWSRYTFRYLIHMTTLDEDISNLLNIVGQVQSCLLCFEADHIRCHRSFVANRVSEMSAGEIIINPIASPILKRVEWLNPVLA